MFLSVVSPGFCFVLERRCRLGGLGGKVGSACEEFEDTMVVYWVNVSESCCRLAGVVPDKGL